MRVRGQVDRWREDSGSGSGECVSVWGSRTARITGGNWGRISG